MDQRQRHDPQSGAHALSLRGITKRFPGVLALDGVDLDLRHGEIHALLGENGAGKSTLIKILTGLYTPASGEILIDGRRVTLGSPIEASRHGITLVPQDVLVVPQLSIGRNILLGGERLSVRQTVLSRTEYDLVKTALSKMGATFDPRLPASKLSLPHLRLAQIARALLHPGSIMVLDEPTAALSEPDANHLLDRLEALRADGLAILYVTHRLSEVLRIADRSTILRDGRRVASFLRGEADRSAIVRMMAKEVAAADATVMSNQAAELPVRHAEGKYTRLEIRNLSRLGAFDNVSLSTESGRVIGIAGVQGSGHGYLLRAIAGVDRPSSGTVTLGGKALKSGSLAAAFQAGMLMVPADRRGAAIVPSMSTRENLVISNRIDSHARAWGLRWPGRESALTWKYIKNLSIRPPSVEVKIATLSGGNQQKLVLARVLEARPAVLLIEEPTQGVDVAAKAEIHRLLLKAARDDGVIVIIASSEFEELIGLADEIHIMRSGCLVGRIEGTAVTYAEILQSALS